MELPIALSNRHLHLSEEHLEVLFGKDHTLTAIKPLSQPGQFACEEKVDVIGPKGILKGLRVLGPTRAKTQIEVSCFDARTLGVPAVLRESGDLSGSSRAKIVGPCGEVEIAEGVIVASRHIHMHTSDAERFGVKDKDIVHIETKGPRGVIFKNVLIRAREDYALEMHVDIEEGNAAGCKDADKVELIKLG